MTDTSTDPYAITVDPDGVTFRRFCNLCPSQAVGNDETLIRETAENHLGEAHSTRTNSTASEAVANGEIRTLQAALARVLAECDALSNGVEVFERTGQGHAVEVTRVAIARIRAAIKGPTQ